MPKTPFSVTEGWTPSKPSPTPLPTAKVRDHAKASEISTIKKLLAEIEKTDDTKHANDVVRCQQVVERLRGISSSRGLRELGDARKALAEADPHKFVDACEQQETARLELSEAVSVVVAAALATAEQDFHAYVEAREQELNDEGLPLHGERDKHGKIKDWALWHDPICQSRAEAIHATGDLLSRISDRETVLSGASGLEGLSLELIQ